MNSAYLLRSTFLMGLRSKIICNVKFINVCGSADWVVTTKSHDVKFAAGFSDLNLIRVLQYSADWKIT